MHSNHKSPQRPLLAVAACTGLAALSLLVLPVALAYDPWAWLVWGKELAHFDLDTGAGPSWKPLPVAIAALLSPAGDATPALWLVVARTAWLLSVVLAQRVGARLGGRAAGVFAAIALVLIDDPATPWIRHFGAGLSEPIAVMFLLLAVERSLAGARRSALAALALCGLLRPEAWILTAIYGVVVARRDRALRPYAAAAVVLPIAVWLGGDALGSGDPFGGGRRAILPEARAPAGLGGHLGAGWDALVAGARLIPFFAWPGIAYALGREWRSRPAAARPATIIAGTALAWIVTVALLVILGFPPLGRFSIPAAALLCVAAGVGFGSAIGRVGRRAWAPAVAVLAVLAVPRLTAISDEVRVVADRARSERELRAALDAADLPVPGCDRVQIHDFVYGPVIAWELHRPLRGVVARSRSVEPGLIVSGGNDTAYRGPAYIATRLSGSGDWTVAAYACGPDSARAGVEGATR